MSRQDFSEQEVLNILWKQEYNGSYRGQKNLVEQLLGGLLLSSTCPVRFFKDTLHTVPINVMFLACSSLEIISLVQKYYFMPTKLCYVICWV